MKRRRVRVAASLVEQMRVAAGGREESLKLLEQRAQRGVVLNSEARQQGAPEGLDHRVRLFEEGGASGADPDTNVAVSTPPALNQAARLELAEVPVHHLPAHGARPRQLSRAERLPGANEREQLVLPRRQPDEGEVPIEVAGEGPTDLRHQREDTVLRDTRLGVDPFVHELPRCVNNPRVCAQRAGARPPHRRLFRAPSPATGMSHLRPPRLAGLES